MLTIACYSLFTFLGAVATSVGQLAAFRLLAGVGIGGEWSMGGTFVAEEWPEERRQMAAGAMHTGYYVGFFLAAIANYTIGARWGWRAMFALGGTPALLVAFIRYGVAESKRWQSRRVDQGRPWTMGRAFAVAQNGKPGPVFVEIPSDVAGTAAEVPRYRRPLVGSAVLRGKGMTAKAPARRCAVYTRKSSEEGLEQDFNSLHAQREACEAFIRSQRGEGWRLIETAYDDGGLSGGTLERPALQRLFADIAQHRVETVVVYKVDRLTRSL